MAQSAQATKRCGQCKNLKPVNDFCRVNRNRDGLHSLCKDCRAIKRAETRARHPRPKAPDLRQCKSCKEWFSRAETGTLVYCSDACFRNRKAVTPVSEQRHCVGCPKVFEARVGSPQMYCSEHCFSETKSRRIAEKVRYCKFKPCGQPFSRAERGKQAQLCSDECKRAQRRIDKVAASNRCTAKAEKVRCDGCGLWFQRQPGSVITTCKSCREGKPVLHGVTRTYDRGCRCPDCTAVTSKARLVRKYRRVAETGIPLDVSHRARARRLGVPHEHINKQWVFERDSWICGLCGEPVDREANYPAGLSATLDHMWPMTRPGTPGHVYENVQCAHAMCNWVKNDGRRNASMYPLSFTWRRRPGE
jgi:hypothetical protein